MKNTAETRIRLLQEMVNNGYWLACSIEDFAINPTTGAMIPEFYEKFKAWCVANGRGWQGGE